MSHSRFICSKCGVGNSESSAFCFKCGNMLQNRPIKNQSPKTIPPPSSINKFFCSNCGEGNLIGSSFCSSCGNELKEPLKKNPVLDKVATNLMSAEQTYNSHTSKSEIESSFVNYEMKPKSNLEKKSRTTVYGIFRCGHTAKDFGVKIEEISSGVWSLTNPTPVESGLKAYHEKLDIEGTFVHDEYSGCPYCGAIGIIRCFCERIFCWDLSQDEFTCPWCGESGVPSGTFTTMRAGSDL